MLWYIFIIWSSLISLKKSVNCIITKKKSIVNYFFRISFEKILEHHPLDRIKTYIAICFPDPFRQPGLCFHKSIISENCDSDIRSSKYICHGIIGIIFNTWQIALIRISIYLVWAIDKPIIKSIKDGIDNIPCHYPKEKVIIFVYKLDKSSTYRRHQTSSCIILCWIPYLQKEWISEILD